MSARTLGYCGLLLLAGAVGFFLTAALLSKGIPADAGTQSPPGEAPPLLPDPIDPPPTLRYEVEWTETGIVFHHPDERGEVPGELFVPLDHPVVLEFHSTEDWDIAIPAFRIYTTIRAHRFATIWFQANAPGSYEILHRKSSEESYELAGYVRVGRR